MGYGNPVGFGNYQTIAYATEEISKDYIGRPVEDSPFIIDKVDRSGVNPTSYHNEGAVNNWIGYDTYDISNVICGRLAYDYGWHVTPATKSDIEIATETLARTNPSRPTVNPGAMLQSLWELLPMLKNAGDQLKNGRPPKRLGGAKNASNVYLGILFGWAPIFDDLDTLLNVYKYVERRNAELRALYEKKGGAHHRVKFGSHHASEGPYSDIIDSGGFFGLCTATRVAETKLDVWATVRWYPSTAPGWHPSDAEYLALAKKVVSGATASGAFVAAWDLIPWTWLLGWVLNVRSFVLANGNTIPAHSSGVSIMRHWETTHRFSNGWSNKGIDLGLGTIRVSRKQRFIFSGTTFGAFLPHIDAGRLSVLSALTVQRLR
jgi:hypothetical protein